MATAAALKEKDIADVKIDETAQSSPSPAAATGSFKLPDFSKERHLFAVASRSAGRLNAASISPSEVAKLLIERQSLLDKKFEGTMSREESNRLEYVRWSLDRVEDAQTGEMLDRLEGYLIQYENLLENIQDLRRQLFAG